MVGKFDDIEIRGIVTCIPKNEEDMQEFVEHLGEKRVKKQIRMTGVKSRHISHTSQMVADLAIPAAKTLMDRLSWKPEDIRVLVLVTQHPSFVTPATSFFIQRELGISKECLVFDVNLGCSGYVSALRIVSSCLRQFGLEQGNPKGILLAGDIQRDPYQVGPKTADQWADMMLFGDGVSATGIELTQEGSPYFFEEYSDGSDFLTLLQEHDRARVMDGERIFEYAINDVTDYIGQFCEALPKELTRPEFYVFHQAQKFMLQNVAMVLSIDEEKMLYSLEHHGNTSSASIPLAICLNRDRIRRYDAGKIPLLLCGFGMGLSCSIAYLSVDTNLVLELVESDEKIPYKRQSE